jgi:hypothetical protein
VNLVQGPLRAPAPEDRHRSHNKLQWLRRELFFFMQTCEHPVNPPQLPPVYALQVKPTHILNAAGVTGRPNVDWCEDHKVGAGHSSGGGGNPPVFRRRAPFSHVMVWLLAGRGSQATALHIRHGRTGQRLRHGAVGRHDAADDIRPLLPQPRRLRPSAPTSSAASTWQTSACRRACT